MDSWSPETKLRTGLCRLDSFGRIVSIWNWPDELKEVADSIEDGKVSIERHDAQDHSGCDNQILKHDSDVPNKRWFDPLQILQGSELQVHGGIRHVPLVARLQRMYLAPLSAVLINWHLRSIRGDCSTNGAADLHEGDPSGPEDSDSDLPALEGPDIFDSEYEGLPKLERVPHKVNESGEFAGCPICDSSDYKFTHRGHDLRVCRMWSGCIDAGAVVLTIHALSSTLGFPENTLRELVDSVMDVYHALIGTR